MKLIKEIRIFKNGSAVIFYRSGKFEIIPKTKVNFEK